MASPFPERTPITGRTSAELRERCMQERFIPFAKRVFDALPEANSVVYAVGQFWCDEADDAVHEAMLPSLDRDPKWPQFLRPPLYAADGGSDLAPDADARLIGPGGTGLFRLGFSFPDLDENSTMITAFAAFCAEEGDQDMTVAESHVPYAIARRGAGGAVELEIVGVLSRPEWEDRFDVGYDDETDRQLPGPTGRAGLYDGPVSPPAPPPSRGGLLGFLRRIFGRRS